MKTTKAYTRKKTNMSKKIFMSFMKAQDSHFLSWCTDTLNTGQY